jgi:hypothetical protein
MESMSENEKDHSKGFDYFFVIGLNNNEIQGEKSLNELINSTPQIISMFPDKDIVEPEDQDEKKFNKNDTIQNVRDLINSK